MYKSIERPRSCMHRLDWTIVWSSALTYPPPLLCVAHYPFFFSLSEGCFGCCSFWLSPLLALNALSTSAMILARSSAHPSASANASAPSSQSPLMNTSRTLFSILVSVGGWFSKTQVSASGSTSQSTRTRRFPTPACSLSLSLSLSLSHTHTHTTSVIARIVL